jgi:hypothetical protein
MLTVTIKQDTDQENPREWDNFGTMVCFHNRYRLGDDHGLTLDEARELEQRDDIISLPLYLYDHSGITMKTTPFHCPWDSGKVGFIYITKKEARSMFFVKRITQKLKNDILDILRQEVVYYDNYLTGEVYGFEITNDKGEFINSCGGYFGDKGIEGIKTEFSDKTVYNVIEP